MIKVQENLSYEQADLLIENNHDFWGLLNKFCKCAQERRLEKGALNLARKEFEFEFMNEGPPIIETEDFLFQVNQIRQWTEETGSRVVVEGLRGSSWAFFLSKLIQFNSRPIVVFTADQTQGEVLLEDLKYFLDYEKSIKDAEAQINNLFKD